MAWSCPSFVARLADRVGRRPLLLWSILGYTMLTALTATAWNLRSFALFQFGSRVLLGAEVVGAGTIVVEEFPADRRGRSLGTLLAWEAAGTIAVAVLLAGASRRLPWGGGRSSSSGWCRSPASQWGGGSCGSHRGS